MHDIVLGLSRSGFEITVLCPQTEDGELLQGSSITMCPVLQEPGIRSLNLNERLSNLKEIAKSLEGVDVVWTLDEPFPLKTEKPIVLSLGTVAYKDELDALLSFNWDTLIAASHYIASVARSVMETATWVKGQKSVEVILNGIDVSLFTPTDSSLLLSRLGLSPSNSYVLFPHRPEPEKGFETALQVMKVLAETNPEYTMLVPTNPQSVKASLAKQAAYYEYIRSRVDQLGITDSVVFHEWIPLSELPAYFSLGDWCLTLSELPEGFGFVPVQSISCGTPVISTKSGALRERFPPGHGVKFVDGVDEVIRNIRQGCSNAALTKGRNYVENNYGIERCVDEYAKCFRRFGQVTSLPVA